MAHCSNVFRDDRTEGNNDFSARIAAKHPTEPMLDGFVPGFDDASKFGREFLSRPTGARCESREAGERYNPANLSHGFLFTLKCEVRSYQVSAPGVVRKILSYGCKQYAD